MMNKIVLPRIVVTIVIVLSFLSLNARDTQDTIQNSFHIRKGFQPWGDGNFQQYKFNDTDKSIDYFYMFPVEQIEKIIPNEIMKNWEIEYKIMTSIEEAELAMVEYLEGSNLGVHNIIDSLLPNGPIGDNCWHNIDYGVVRFLRNNLYINISPKNMFSDKGFLHSVESLARQLDSIIVKSEKIKDIKLLKAPEASSFEMISELPKKWGDFVHFKLMATAPNPQQLFFREYGAGLAIISKTGEIISILDENLDKGEDSTVATVKVWIWNENNVYTLHYQKIPF